MRKILFCLALIATSACTSKTPAIVNNYSDRYYGYGAEETGILYLTHPEYVIAEPGHTYAEIARRYNILYEDILKRNKVIQDQRLIGGEIIYLPQLMYHKVVCGENLERIANIYQVDATTILNSNASITDPDNLVVGNILRIPIEGVSEPDMQEISPHFEDPQVTSDFLDPSGAASAPINTSVSLGDKEKLPFAVVKPSTETTFLWPVKGEVIKKFNLKANSEGINIKASLKTPIKASADGVVIYAGDELKSYGYLVIIKHEGGWLTAYGHQNSVKVSKGDKVGQGDIIGYVGNNGDITEPQLYFTIRQGTKSVDPLNYLPK